MTTTARTTGRSRRWPSPIPYLYLLPALAVAGIFVYLPLVQTVVLSFFDWSVVRPERTFVGWDNYRTLVADPRLGDVLGQTVAYIAIALIANTALPIGLALLTLQIGGRAAGLYQTLLFVPAVVATSIGAMLWQWMYSPNAGLVNATLEVFGLPERRWLADTDTALGAVAVMTAWKFVGFNFLIALAGLRAIRVDLIEAARLDGATGWKLLWTVILPLLNPTTVFLIATTILTALPNVFTPIQILTQGGPARGTSNMLYETYEAGFRFFQAGRASTWSVVTMVVFALAAYGYFRIADRRVDHEG